MPIQRARPAPDGPEDAQDTVADADRVVTEARSARRQLANAADQTADPDAASSP